MPGKRRVVMSRDRRVKSRLSVGKTPLSGLDMHGESIIVVGSPELAARIAQTGRERVVAFSSLQELDRWREQQLEDETFGPDIEGALNEIGCSLASLPLRLRVQLEAIGTRTPVPPVRELQRRRPCVPPAYRPG